jgi:hypothetical protein
MKTLFFFLLVILLPAFGHAQETVAAKQVDKEMRDMGMIREVRWKDGTENADSMVVEGREVKMITDANLTVSATLIVRKHWIPHVLITVNNTSTERFLVDPADWTLEVISPKARTLASKDPDQLAKSIGRRTAFANAVGQAGAGMATTQSTVRDSNGKTATVTTPDYGAQQRAANTARANEEEATSVADYINKSSLRANTVLPGKSVMGIVWFEDKAYEDVLLKVKIAGTTYEFPFSKKK